MQTVWSSKKINNNSRVTFEFDCCEAIRGKILLKFGALCKHFRKNIAPETSPAKILGPKSFRVFWETNTSLFMGAPGFG